jgi:hypothetical protein
MDIGKWPNGNFHYATYMRTANSTITKTRLDGLAVLPMLPLALTGDSYWKHAHRIRPQHEFSVRFSCNHIVHTGRTDLVLDATYLGCTRVNATLLYSSPRAPRDLFLSTFSQRMKRAPQRDCRAARAVLNARSGVHSVHGPIP